MGAFMNFFVDIPCVVRFQSNVTGSIDKGNFNVTYDVSVFLKGQEIPLVVQEDFNRLLYLLLNNKK